MGDANTEFADITGAIKDTAPVGSVKSVRLPCEKKKGVIRAKFLLHSQDAACLLVKAGRDGRSKVKDKKVDAIIQIDGHQYRSPGKLKVNNPRVLKIRGHPDAFEKLSVESLQNHLRSDPKAMNSAGDYGLQSEAIKTQRTKN